MNQMHLRHIFRERKSIGVASVAWAHRIIGITAVCIAALAVLIMPSHVVAELPIPNPSFEQGQPSVTAWTLSGTGGRTVTPGAVGQRAIALDGDGHASANWLSTPLDFQPGSIYRLRFQVRRLKGQGGLATTGPVFCNRDLSSPGPKWTSIDSYFQTPDRLSRDQACLRFGQWELAGTIAYDDIHLDRVIAVYQTEGDFTLGQGELLNGNRYSFVTPAGGPSGNCARPLAQQQCDFNTDRWRFSNVQDVVVYRHEIGRQQVQAHVSAQISWYSRGQLVVSASRDATTWIRLGTLDKLGGVSFDIPAVLLPADAVYIRLSAESTPNSDQPPSLQVDKYQYEATFSGAPADLDGNTHFVAVTEYDPQFPTNITSLGNGVPGGTNYIALQLKNDTGKDASVHAIVSITAPDGTTRQFANVRDVVLPPTATLPIQLPYELAGVGRHQISVSLRQVDPAPVATAPRSDASLTASDPVIFTAESAVDVPALYASNFGALLPESTPHVGLWTCSGGWKVSTQRPLPTKGTPDILVRAAANETEAVQLVVHPTQKLARLTVQVGALSGPDGTTIGADQVEVLRVRYVHVTQPTDATGARGLWPDPLPPLTGPCDLPTNRNQPFWLRLHVPKGTRPGTYRGSVTLSATDYHQTVTLRVEVYGFELPDRMTCQTAFGLDTSTIWRYHGTTRTDQRRQVLAKYLKTLAQHHISPYDPAPLDPIRITWSNTPPWQGGVRDAEIAHSKKASLRLDDQSRSANQSAEFVPHIPIGPQGVTLAFWYRTGTPTDVFTVTLNHFDRNGKWMSGRNNDVTITGNGKWQRFERRFVSFPKDAKTIQLRLWATRYHESGTPTGTVWFDQVELTDSATNKPLVTGGDFEDDQQPTPQPRIDFTAWDEAMRRAIDTDYHFNTFRLPVLGLGGGTFHDRYEPQLQGYAESSPQYQKAMATYLGLLQDHLRNHGWLDETFVYWFDEPDPKDYAFVMSGFAKLKRWAPDLRRMLTEQVEPALIGGPNLWCPVSPRFDLEQAEARRKQGEHFWWYICTGPKAPFCTLFIDHPATELRVWLWQTWQRNIRGILVWSTNYWTSSAAYPDPKHPQNPYLDPMGWVSGYSTPAGTRRAWGNGDGRFLYPPESAADGHPTKAILDAPVASIRLEMLRDGIEDYEYCVILKRLLRQHQTSLARAQAKAFESLLTVPDEITADTTHFTNDPAPIESRRDAIARAIEQLQK